MTKQRDWYGDSMEVQLGVEVPRPSSTLTIGQRSKMPTLHFAEILGVSELTQELRERVDLVAPRNTSVVITGETGVGKDVVANVIHRKSGRREFPFAALNCAAFTDLVLETELFGHIRGSFTNADDDRRGRLSTADRGTVFLDEVAEMSPRMQAILLRFLDSGEIQRVGDPEREKVDVRIISATNRDLMSLVESGRFRADLYYRLNVVQIHIAPLRDRPEDIVPLAEYFFGRFREHYGDSVVAQGISSECANKLIAYHWPGNTRELRSVIERAVAISQTELIEPEDLPFEIVPVFVPRSRPEPPDVVGDMYKRIVEGKGFLEVVVPAYLAREMSRQEVVELVARGSATVSGNLERMLEFFKVTNERQKFENFMTSVIKKKK